MADKNFKVKNNIIVNDVEIDPSSPTAEQILRYNGTKFLAANSGIPTGGLEGQILSKITDTSYDTQWIDNFADQLRVIAKNSTASTINKGVAVMSTGSAGDRITIAPANADGSIEVKYMLGVTVANIAAGAEGYVTLVGPVTGLNTNAYTVGDILYIDPNTPGAFTTTQPTAPDVDLPLAIVLKKNASAGIIFVRMWSQGAKLGELQDVNVAGVTDGQVLAYDSATATWVPETVSGAGGAKITVSDTPPVSPSTGDIWYESDTSQSYIYYDSYWVETGAEPGQRGTYYVSDTAPLSPTAGDVWFESDTGRTFVYYDSFWVEFGANAGIPLPGSNGDVLVSDSGSTSGLRWQGQANTGRNLVINGAMQVAQRGTSTTGITGIGYYTADRWQTSIGSLGAWTQTVENDAPTGSGFSKSLKILCTTADASPAANDFFTLVQKLEGQDVQRILKGTSSAQQLTLSFWVKSNVTGTYIVELYDADNTRFVGASVSVSASGTWEKKTVTFPADTTGALNNDNGESLTIVFWLAAGSSFSSGGSLGTTWNTTQANRAVGQTNLAAATNNYWQVTGVQLEVGPVATGFDFEPYETTLRKCQRYYYRLETGSSARLGSGYNTSTAGQVSVIGFPTEMRVSPTALETSGTAADYQIQYGNFSVQVCSAVPAFLTGTKSSAGVSNTVAANLTAGQGSLFLSVSSAGYLAWSAEL